MEYPTVPVRKLFEIDLILYIYIYANIDKRISFPFNLNSLLFVRIDKNYLKRDYIYYDKCLLFIE